MNNLRAGDLLYLQGPRWLYACGKDIHSKYNQSINDFSDSKLAILLRQHKCYHECQCELLDILYEGNIYTLFFLQSTTKLISAYENCYDV